MGSRPKPKKNKIVAIDPKIALNTNKQPRSQCIDPLTYDKEYPAWSFKRISKETMWTFKPNELVALEDDGTLSTQCIMSLLSSFESMTWGDIKKITHGKKNRSSNHLIDNSLDNLCDKAKIRLNKLKISGNFFSLRLGGKIRIFGILESRVLEILWYDDEHKIYPVGD